MDEWRITRLMCGSVIGVLSGVASFFGLCAWVFPTKEQVEKDCHACRTEIYSKLNEKANTDDLRRLESKVDNLAPQINTINQNVVRIATTIELKLGAPQNV